MPAKKDDLGQAEMQKDRDESVEKGHWGEKPAGPDNAEYTLKTGPNSPTALDAKFAAMEHRAEQMRKSVGDNG